MTKVIVFLILLNAGRVCAQTTLPIDYKAQLQEVLDEYIVENNVQSITASVLFKDGASFQGSTGFSYDDVLMDTTFLVGIGSNTKLFTAVLSVLLSSDGYFQLDDPISKWLDPIQYVDPKITLRQLLQHNSGVNDFIGNTEIYPAQILNEPNKVWTPEETLSYIFEPITTPNTGVYYSNANYILLGMIIEKASGAIFHELVREYIIDPLSLEDIYFEGFEEVDGELAHPFLFGFDYSSTPRIALGTTTWSAGCMVSRPFTLVKWYDALFNQSFLSEEQVNTILDFLPWPDDPEGREMGLGIYRISIDDKLYYGHGGRTVGYTSFTLFDTNAGNSISVAINQFFADAYPLALKLAEKAEELTVSSGVKEIPKDFFIVYPNPSTELVTVKNADRIFLFNTSGQLMKSSQSSKINISDLNPGIYLLKVPHKAAFFTEKLIVQ